MIKTLNKYFNFEWMLIASGVALIIGYFVHKQDVNYLIVSMILMAWSEVVGLKREMKQMKGER